MIIFYGLDNVLINQEVNSYLKEKKHENDYYVTYYLELETFELVIAKILNDVTTYDLMNNKKIIIINDYDSLLNSNISMWEIFKNKLKMNSNNNIVIIKFLTSTIKSDILNSVDQSFFIPLYNKIKMKKWLVEKLKKYQINFSEEQKEIFINILPKSLNIVDNELKKYQNLPKELIKEQLEKLKVKYFDNNPYFLINIWLKKDYQNFWWQYRFFWEKINYDKSNLFAILIFQLELIRNIKVLEKQNFSEKLIIEKLNITIQQFKIINKHQLELKELNYLLLMAHDYDSKIKKGKIAKNLAFDLFFCRI